MENRGLLGERRGPRAGFATAVKGVGNLIRLGLKFGLPVRIADGRLHGRPHRPTANYLAKRTKAGDVRRRVQVTSITMFRLADLDDVFVMVNNLRSEQMDFADKQHAYHQHAKPIAVPQSGPPDHCEVFALSPERN